VNASRNHPINCGFATSTSFALQYIKRSSAGFLVDANQRSRVLSFGGQSEVVRQDRVVFRRTSSSGVYDVQAEALPNIGRFEQPYTFVSSDASILAQPDEDGLLQHISDGSVMLAAISGTGETVLTRVQSESFEETTVDTFVRWVEGSAADTLTRNVIDYTDGTFEQIVYGPGFSSGRLNMLNPPGPYAASGWIRNTNFWLGHIDWSCVSIRNSLGHARGGTLISPRYAVCAAHFPIPAGATLTFLTADSLPVVRTVESSTTFPWPLYDTQVLRLSQPLTYEVDGIRFSKVLPLSYSNFLKGALRAGSVADSPAFRGIGGVIVNQDKLAGPTAVRLTNANNFTAGGWGALGSFDAYQPRVLIRVGDSGHPCFLVFNDEPVLVGTWTSIGSGLNNPADSNFSVLLNNILAADGESLTPIDLSAFPTY
jgi:hypothetical protein